MADSDAQANWQQITKLALSIVAVVGIVIVPRLPHGVVRPNVSPPAENRFVSAQSVDARLWQDPFEAVDADRERRRTAGQGSGAAAALEAWRSSARYMEQQVRHRAGETKAPPLVLLAFVPGGPYPENVESRRRTRYATLSGLRAAGLIPVDAEHIGYFETGDQGRLAGLPPLIVYEWLQVTASRKSSRLDSVLLLWLDERTFGNATVRKTAALLAEAGVCHEGQRLFPARLVMLGPAESSSVRRLVEDVEGVSPHDVDCLRPTLVLSTATVPDDYIIPGSGRDGGIVRGSVRERMKSASIASMAQWLDGAGLRFTRVLPTDEDLIKELDQELGARGVTLRPRNLERPTPGEMKTRVAIVSEWDTLYGRRGVEVVSNFVCGERRGAAASTDLTRASDNSWCGGRVQLFEYPRGLDGVVPGRDTKKTGERADKAGQGLFAGPGDPGERAEGAPQVDYVRRLAAQIDRVVSSSDASGASWRNDHPLVIGVLGSDPYDKLLILQALRPQHPQAIFFTFDLDARMLHGDEFSWTRNLLVISPLGLRLRPELQGSIPPFRDSYQTAHFLSTRVAVDHARFEMKLDDPGTIFTAAWQPRVFEIGRGQEFDLSVEDKKEECGSALTCGDVAPQPPALGLTLPKPNWWWITVAGLGGFLLFVFSSATRTVLERTLNTWRRCLVWAAGLVAGAAILLLLGAASQAWLAESRPEPFSWNGGVSMWPTEIVRVVALLLALVFCVVAVRTVRAAAGAIAAHYDLESDGAPASLYAGVGGLADRHGAANAHPAPAQPVPDGRSGGWWREIYAAITLREFDRLARQEPTRSADLWAEYRRQSQGWRLHLRIALTMLLGAGVAILLIRYFGVPRLPARGIAIRTIDPLILFFLCAPVALWLQMYVVDMIRLCDKVAMALGADRPTFWPPELGKRLWSRLAASNGAGIPASAGASATADASPTTNGVSGEGARSGAAMAGARPGDGAVASGIAVRSAVASAPASTSARLSSASAEDDDDSSYWLDIRFTSEWTARVSWLAYLPVIAICLMMAAPNRFFDDWDTSPGLYAGFALSVAFMIGCVGLLMRRANLLRRGALRHLKARLRQLVGSGSGADIERVKLMIQEVERADDGAFAPLTRQPIFGALAVTFGSAGITAVAQYVMGIR